MRSSLCFLPLAAGFLSSPLYAQEPRRDPPAVEDLQGKKAEKRSEAARKVCPVDGERMNGSWSYCPWHGKALTTTRTPPDAMGLGTREVHRVYAEPRHRRTFGPMQETPAGTTFYVRVVKQDTSASIRLHLCGEPCDTAVTVKTWMPESYASGDELSSRVDTTGRYYLWSQDLESGKPLTVVSEEIVEGRLRMELDSGAILEAWYVTP